MKIIIDNVLRISNPTKEILDFCKKELEINNPEYFKNQMLGFSVWKIPQKLRWFEKKGEDIIIPFRMLE